MACGGCRNGKGARHTTTSGDLSRFAFLSPKQLRLLKEKESDQAPETVPVDEGKE